MGLLPMACASPMLALITLAKGFLTPAWISFSMAVALMTRGPLTAYSIFLMQGFMLSRVTVAGAVAAMLELVLERFLADTSSFCLKLIIVRWVATNTRPGSGSPLSVSWMVVVVVVGGVVDSARGRQPTEGCSWQQTKEKLLPPPTKTRFEAV